MLHLITILNYIVTSASKVIFFFFTNVRTCLHMSDLHPYLFSAKASSLYFSCFIIKSFYSLIITSFLLIYFLILLRSIYQSRCFSYFSTIISKFPSSHFLHVIHHNLYVFISSVVQAEVNSVYPPVVPNTIPAAEKSNQKSNQISSIASTATATIVPSGTYVTFNTDYYLS